MESSPGAMSAAVTVSDVVTDTQTGVLSHKGSHRARADSTLYCGEETPLFNTASLDRFIKHRLTG